MRKTTQRTLELENELLQELPNPQSNQEAISNLQNILREIKVIIERGLYVDKKV